MKTLDIQVNLNYEVAYLPSKRHKLQHTRTEQETITVSIPQLEQGEAPIAFKVKDYGKSVTYYHHNSKLWRIIKWNEKGNDKSGNYPIAELIKTIKNKAEDMPYWAGNQSLRENREVHTKECQLKHLQKILDSYLIIGNHVYQPIGEPRYVMHTFGLGHNHGGTSLSVQNWYNSNIPNTSYFPANKRKEAIAYAKEVAKGRGDTEYVRRIGKWCDIKTFMPELVTCDPMNEHGEGDNFTNRLENIISNSGSRLEAGLLAIALTDKEINK